MSAAGGDNMDGRDGMHHSTCNIIKRGKTHIWAIERDFLAGFIVEAFVLDDDAALCLGCLAHIGNFSRVACVGLAAAF